MALTKWPKMQHWGEPVADTSLCISVTIPTIPRHLCVIARPLSATCGTHHIMRSATLAHRAEISAEHLPQPASWPGASEKACPGPTPATKRWGGATWPATGVVVTCAAPFPSPLPVTLVILTADCTQVTESECRGEG